jgi:hypothetical protein
MNNAHIDRRRLYLIGNLSIFMIGLGFAVRGNIADKLTFTFFNDGIHNGTGVYARTRLQ